MVFTAAAVAVLLVARRLDAAGLVLSVVGLAAALLWAFPLYWSIATTLVPPPKQATGSVLLDFGNALGKRCHFGGEPPDFAIHLLEFYKPFEIGIHEGVLRF